MKSKFILAIGLVLVVLICGLTGCAERIANAADVQPISVNVNNGQQGINVNGEGRVSVTPDIAMVYLGVTAQADTVAEAQQQAASAMDKVMASLTSNGIEKKDIQTQSYSIQQISKAVYPKMAAPSIGSSIAGGSAIAPMPPMPTISSDSAGKAEIAPMPALPPTPTTTPQIAYAYQVSNMVVAKIRAIDKTGPILDAVTAAGGDLTRVNSVSFTIDQPDQYYVQARALAMKDAQTKAAALANLGGVTLGKATFISENTYTSAVPVPMYKAAAGGASYSTPINPGQSDIVLDIQVNYAIQ